MQTDSDVKDASADSKVENLLNDPPEQHKGLVLYIQKEFETALVAYKESLKQKKMKALIEEIQTSPPLPKELMSYLFINDDIKHPAPIRSPDELLRLSDKGLPFFLCNACDRGVSFFLTCCQIQNLILN